MNPTQASDDRSGGRCHVIYVGSARCFHTMDWFRSTQRLYAPKTVSFATDLIESEGQPRLVNDQDDLIRLCVIDPVLLHGQSSLGNLWRNVVKTILIPWQAYLLRRVARRARRDPEPIFHAHSMYYLFLCRVAGVRYVGTPQGSEVLVRPWRSRLYRWFATRALGGASAITVDSVNMQRRVEELCGRPSHLIQNGIDIERIRSQAAKPGKRWRVVSNRGIYPNYQIERIFAARAQCPTEVPLTFCYPFFEEQYRASCFRALRPGDADLGRLGSRAELYGILAETRLVISIPGSDSSPRSVYEAIFCGCGVATTYSPWIETVPACMRARLHVIESLDDPGWLERALAWADALTQTPFRPSEEALDLFDQGRSLRRLAGLCYGGSAGPDRISNRCP